MVGTSSDGNLMCNSEGSGRGRNVVAMSEAAVSSHSVGATFARRLLAALPHSTAFSYLLRPFRGLRVRGHGVEEKSHPLGRVGGLHSPQSRGMGGATAGTAVGGYYLEVLLMWGSGRISSRGGYTPKEGT